MSAGSSHVAFAHYDPHDERRRESLFALGNGVLLVRGCAPDAVADGRHYPGTYHAGVYDRSADVIAGERVENESLVNLPNWLPVTFRIAGDAVPLSLDAVTIRAYRQALDTASGVSCREVRFTDARGRTTELCEERLVSMACPTLAAMRLVLRPVDWSGEVECRSAIDGAVRNENVERERAYDGHHLDVGACEAPAPDLLLVRARTRTSAVEVAVAARTRVEPAGADRTVVPGDRRIGMHVRRCVTPDAPLVVEKTAAIVTTRDPATGAPAAAALATLREAPGWDALRASHARAWARLWEHRPVAVARAGVAPALARHRFHLLQTLSPHSADVDTGFPAHGWQESYRGQVFWDELLLVPFLAAWRPSLARGLLAYRHRRLAEARHAARRAGLRGAMYPWRSATTGAEVTPAFQCNPASGRWLRDETWRQRHVGAAIAYDVWHYQVATGDTEFLRERGAEMLLEIARFFASAAQPDARRGRWVIRGVVGPDEFHTHDPSTGRPGLADNAYTNVMASWTLARALELLEHLDAESRRELCRVLDLGDAELAHWDEVSRRLRLTFHDDGILSQFDGWETLRELDRDALERRHPGVRTDWALEAEGDDVNAYRIAKQADVVMLLHLLPGRLLDRALHRLGHHVPPDQLHRIAAYYGARTTHASSLSRIVHAGALARLDPAESWRLFRMALQVDAERESATASAEGLHLGAMAGVLDVLHRHYLGLGFDLRGMRLDPAPPAELGPVCARVEHRGDDFVLAWDERTLTLAAARTNRATVRVDVRGEPRLLAPGGLVAVGDVSAAHD